MDNLPDGDYCFRLTSLLFFGVAHLPAEIAAGALIFGFLLICSGLISGSEVGFFSLTENEFKLLRERNNRTSRTILLLLSKPRYLLSTILICNNLVNISIIILSYYLLYDFVYHNPILGFAVNVLGVTFFLVVFGEVLPKIYATKHNVQAASLMAIPLLFAGKIFKPVNFLLASSSRFIEGRLSNKKGYEFNSLELEHAIDITAGKSSKHEATMLKGIVRFSNTTVRQIMRSRMDVVAVNNQVNFTELLKVVKDAGYSRFPVYRDTLDNVVGILYVKDLLPHLNESSEFKWQRLLRAPVFTPETKKIDTLLKEIQKRGVHLIIAFNEFGGTSGIVTLEDILEEVIGEIRDEYDLAEEEPYFEKIDSKNYVFDGKSLLNDICAKMNLRNDAFDKVREESDTLAGLVLSLSGKMPQKNDEFRRENFAFKVVSTGENRIKRVLITILDDVHV